MTENTEKFLKSAKCAFVSLEETDSTNTLAKKYAKNGAPEWTVIMAESQTAGRGRQGKSFFSPRGTGLYISVILRPKAEGDAVTALTTVAAVCMAEAVENTFSRTPEIKWVNDILIDGKKVCGILTETSFSGKAVPDFAILGIGVNVCPPKEGFPDDLRDIAGYVLKEHDENAKYRLAAAFLDGLFARYDSAFCGGHFEDYRRRCSIEGKKAEVITPTGSYKAEVISLNDDFSLTVETQTGEKIKVLSGEVSVKR